MKRKPKQKIYCLNQHVELGGKHIIIASIVEGIIFRTVYDYKEIQEEKKGIISKNIECSEFYNIKYNNSNNEEQYAQ